MPLPAVEVFFGLIFLATAVLPLGAALLRLGERIFRCKGSLSPPERLLLAFYVSGATLFVLASLPIAFYGYALLITVLVGGAGAYAAICYWDGGAGLRTTLSFVRTAPGVLLAVLTIGLLAIEVDGVAPVILGNMDDGSLHSLFVNLLLTNHTLPWTYSPYATMGVTYPQGAPVWMSVPVLLLGWPIVSAPVDLPPLFLALSPVAAFCFGQRLTTGLSKISEGWAGLLFAALFGLVFTWPRLWIGGSFDFAFGLPLFLLLLGWLVPLVRTSSRSWKEVVAFGVVVGVECSLSAILGVTVLLLFAGYILVLRGRSGPGLRVWAVRWLAVLAISAGFLVRTLVGIGVWFSYPGHVLAPVGNSPPASSGLSPSATYGNVNGELNPFVLFKQKVSPIPLLSLEIMLLLAAGLVLIGVVLIFPGSRVREHLPRPLVLPIVVGTVVAFVETGAVLVADAATQNGAGVSSLLYIEEPSAILFLFYELIATLPLLAAAGLVSGWVRRASPAAYREPKSSTRTTEPRRPWPSTVYVILIALVLLVPLGTGLGSSAVAVPGYITNHIEHQANVTASDIAALEWAGSNLPRCSRVLVAPGSVGQYLPEFATLGVVYPTYPNPENLSYVRVVQDLDSGVYTNETRSLLLQLSVTEVLVSGQNTASYPPFELAPLQSSSDFRVLTAMGDVTILEFLPGTSSTGCVP